MVWGQVNETNQYSVPTEFIGKEVLMKIYHSTLEICFKKDVIATHERAYTKHNKIYDISHYMTALERKPRAIFNAQPVRAFVPNEILDSYSAVPGGNKDVLNYIKSQIGLRDQDVITVKQANLSSYDRLIREVK
ncbi:Mu transposase domain-containing protein [Fusibacter ferrireducens]